MPTMKGPKEPCQEHHHTFTNWESKGLEQEGIALF